MNTYIVTLPVSITIDADNPHAALNTIIDRLRADNINVDDYDIANIDNHVYDCNDLD
jgi:hypothetical protein